METSLDVLKQLRDKSGVSIMQCKKALEEAGGDIEKALIILSKQSSAAAEKRSGRDASDGVVVFKKENDKVVMLALKCETDFVAKNDDFLKTANDILEVACEKGIEEAKNSSDKINTIIQKTGENTVLGDIIEVKGSNLGIYVHSNKYGVIVNMEGGSEELARGIAMHYTAMKPHFISKDEIKEEDREKVIEVFKEEINKSDKPEDIKAKMLDGKIETYFKEMTLLEQLYVKDPSKTIAKLLEENNAKITSVSVVSLS